MAIQLRFGFTFPKVYRPIFWQWVLAFILAKFLLLYILKLYSFSLRYVGIVEFFRLIKAFFLFFALTEAVNLWLLRVYFPPCSLPSGVVIIDSIISFCLFGFIRLINRLYYEFFLPVKTKGKRTLIVGANFKSERLIKGLRMAKVGLVPLLIIDKHPEKVGNEMYGLPVIDYAQDITRSIRLNRIETALINLPQAEHKEVTEVFNRLKKAGLNDIRIVPRMEEWKESVHQIHTINIEDLLARQAIKIDFQGVSEKLHDKTVMVTGAAGSIGSEIVRKLRELQAQRVIAIDMDESGLFNLQQELLPYLTAGQRFIYVVVSICNRHKMHDLFRVYGPQIVFHAAAYKHVPLMEEFPEEAIRTNVLGTYELTLLAEQYKVEKFVNISTDKAVKPRSIMGTSKRLAEMICQGMNQSSTHFISVRFGNVLGSRGSVVPLFIEQIRRGGPITVTHPDMCRYFMTIPEAVLLVMQAQFLSQGGEVFVLEMGEPVRIVELAQNLIRLNGLEPGKDIEIVFTGLRPGEKIREELLTAEEGVVKTIHNKIFIAKFKKQPAANDLQGVIAELQKAINEPNEIRKIIDRFVQTI
ncbi:MAG: nucleoside-diphosphate sugar epimerase/dehydratase [Candidatus Aminicenantes bacterium]|nr:nucleoside-diphosphate sugar epimerase/dehydratase [Candidatus Aminicenantes bacterium]